MIVGSRGSALSLAQVDLFEKTEIVYHACEWDRNYLNIEHKEKLESFLEDNIDNIEFCFMENL